MGKAGRIPTSIDRLKQQQDKIFDLQALNRNRNTPKPVATTAFSGASAAGDVGGQGNFLKTEGGTMIGPIALHPPTNFRVNVDANNTIDIGVSSDNNQYSSNIQLDDLQPDSSVLDIIKGGAFDGQILIIRTFAPTVPYTISQSTIGNSGNILLPTNTDITVGDLETLTFIFDEALISNVNTGGTWRLKSRSNPTGGGTGQLEPVILSTKELTNQTAPTKTNIDASISNVHHITIDRDIAFDIINPPSATKQEGLQITIDINGTGGFASPTWPSSVINPPIIPTTPNTRFTVELYTLNQGVLWTHATSVGSSSGGVTSLSQLTIDVTKDWLAKGVSNFGPLTGVTSVQYVDTGSVVRGSISGDAATSSLRLALSSGGKLIVSDVLTGILEIDDTVGLKMLGTHVINMNKNIINSIKELQFDNSIVFTPSNTNAIAFDFTSKELRYAVALITDEHAWYAATDRLASIKRTGTNQGQLNIHDVISDILQANNQLLISNNTSDPTINGEFRKNGDDVKVFTGGSLLNLSDIGVQNSIVDGDSSVLVTDTALPAAAKIEFILNGSVVGGFTPVSFLPTIPIDMITGLNILNTDNLRFLRNSDTIPISATGFVIDSNGLRLNLEATDDLFTLTYNSATVTHQFSNTALTSPNLITNNTLIINDSTTNPTANGIFSRNGNVLGLEIPEFAVRRTTTTGTDFTSLNIVKVDASPGSGDQISRLNYQIDDSGVIITYAQTRAELRDATDAGRYYISVRADNNSSLVDAIEIIGDDNNLASFINVNARISSNLVFGVESGSTDLKIFPALNSIGITFDNVSYTIGSSGTNQIPHVDVLPASAAGADSVFGTHQAAAGIFDNDVNTLTLFVRQEDGNWGAVTLARDVLT